MADMAAGGTHGGRHGGGQGGRHGCRHGGRHGGGKKLADMELDMSATTLLSRCFVKAQRR